MSNKRIVMIEEKDVVFDVAPPFPRNIMVELTNICNHSCVMCGYRTMSRPKRQCDKSEMTQYIIDAYNCGGREIGFYLIGEPLLNDDLEYYIESAKKTGYEYIYLTTNGALATPDRLKSIIGAGLDSIKFSINGASAETYYQIHGRDDFCSVLGHVEWLRSYLDETRIPLHTYVSFVVVNKNRHEINRIHELFDHLVDEVVVCQCGFEGGGTASELVKNGTVDVLEKRVPPCHMVFNRVHITCEGYLDACCADTEGTLVYADLKEMGIGEAWNSEIIRQLRKEHLGLVKMNHHTCFNCIYQQDFRETSLIQLYS